MKKQMEMLQYKEEAFDGEHALHPKGRHAAAYCQYPPPAYFEDEGLSHINCARGECDDCPDYCRPVLETKLKAGDKKIFFYNYEKLPACSLCGVCDKGTKECPTCSKRKGDDKQPRFNDQKHLVLRHKNFDVFWKSFYEVALQKYKIIFGM